MSVSVRCTPYCNPCNKGYKHHELLTALLNTNTNNTHGEHDYLKKVVKKYVASGWDKNSVIMDKNDEFRFPMLHWACVLGKPRTVRWLLDNGFSPTVQCHDTKETAVHRALMTLPDFMAKNSRGLSLFFEILPSLKECLGVGDLRQDTPIHVAAKFMMRNKNYNLYENLLIKMMSVVQTMPEKEQSDIFNALNSTGDTALHILAGSNKSFNAMQVLMNAGADSFLINKLSISPLDVAIQNGTGRNIMLLKKALVEGYKKSMPSVPVNGSSPCEEVKIRRSERRSNNVLTFNQFYESESSPESRAETESLEEQNDCPTPKGVRNIEKSTLQQKGNKESWHDLTQNKGTLPMSEHEEVEFPPVLVKEEALADNVCHCLDQECTTHIPGEEEEEEEEEHPRTEELSIRDDSEVPILHVMKEAGVLPNLNDVITKTKEGHISRMKVLRKSLKETNEELGKNGEQGKSIEWNMDLKKKELEKLASQLDKLKKEKGDMTRKRKLLEEESGELRKKLICCETLLKTVPKYPPY